MRGKCVLPYKNFPKVQQPQQLLLKIVHNTDNKHISMFLKTEIEFGSVRDSSH